MPSRHHAKSTKKPALIETPSKPLIETPTKPQRKIRYSNYLLEFKFQGTELQKAKIDSLLKKPTDYITLLLPDDIVVKNLADYISKISIIKEYLVPPTFRILFKISHYCSLRFNLEKFKKDLGISEFKYKKTYLTRDSKDNMQTILGKFTN